jgi:hypothetical protein
VGAREGIINEGGHTDKGDGRYGGRESAADTERYLGGRVGGLGGMGWRSSRVHLARLMHRTGSSNGRVGHEYLINNYYRETLYIFARREREPGPRAPPPLPLLPLLARSPAPYHEEAQGPLL